MIGPFTTYAPPNVYTQTIVEPVFGQVLGGLRIPVLIGVGQETLTQTNIEMVRGSSSVADTPIFGEDPSGHWVVGGTNTNPILGNQDGNRVKFRVRNYPIVDGEGVGRVTYDASKISVIMDGQQAIVGAVDGANGIVTLLVTPSEFSVISVSYNFHRKDTRITDDLSAQVTSTSAVLIAPQTESYVVTAGSNDQLQLTIDDTVFATITLTAGTRAASDVANDINAAAVAGLTGSVHIDAQGLSHVQFVALGNISVGSGTANGLLGFNPGAYTNRNRSFRTFNGPIVDGLDGGIITTDPSKVTVLINGLQVIPIAVDGRNQTVTLSAAPRPGATVAVTYYFNTFQDTFDYLPNNNITSVGNVGIAPGRRDYLNGPDFVVINQGDQSIIQWGTSFQVTAGITTGLTPFNGTQIVGMMVDDRIYGVQCQRYADPTTGSVSENTFVLPLSPTTGNGRDTPLGTSLYQTITNGRIDLPTDRPDLVVVHVGKSFRDASSKPAVTVLAVDSITNMVTLRDPVPADYLVYATFWYNRLTDDTYTFTVATPGPSGVGQYTVDSQVNAAPLYGVKFGNKSGLAQTVTWPSGVESMSDAIHYGGTPVPETVTVTFNNALDPATHASFSNAGQEPYDLYDPGSYVFGGVVIDGNPAVSVNLAAAYRAQLLSQPIDIPGTMVFLGTDRLVLTIDGITLAAVDVSAAVSLANVVTAINAIIDADAQVHADGSGTFLASAPNALASAVTYGTQSILKIVGRNVQSAPSTTLASNGLTSNVIVMSPTAPGQTDAASKLSLAPNQTATGSYNAINQAAVMIGTQAAPYNITAGVTDNFQFNVDGSNVGATLPSGAGITLDAVVNAINTAYVPVASAADQALMLAAGIALSTDFTAKYTAHIGNGGGIWHTAADAVNTINPALTPATGLPSLILLLNDQKAKFNAHIITVGAGPVHTIADGTNTIMSSNATDLKSALTLAYELKTKYNTHRSQAGVHALDDGVNLAVFDLLQLVAQTGLGINATKLVLLSRLNTANSSITISSFGTANSILGFTSGSVASRVQSSASALAGALDANAGFAALAVAYPIVSSGLGGFLEINSLTTGTTSTISFTSVANTVFITDTGIGITPGISGDIGENAVSGFVVSSSAGSVGSSGVGIPGQTYTDAITGLRFTVLPTSSGGDYASGGSFTLKIGTTFTADGAIPIREVSGVELTVYNTNGMVAGTTSLVQTYQHKGAEPQIGDIYYVSYNYAKTDLSTALFGDNKRIQQAFGPPTPEFPLSLGARLAMLNGSVLVGLKQVIAVPGTSQASVGSYTAAIDEQKKPISGNIKPDIITPLATDPYIFSYLNQHCVFMSSPRQASERIGIVGCAAGTTPLGVQSIAKGLASELMIVNYPDSYVISVEDSLGNLVDQLVDGSQCAAALCGTLTTPSIDVATPLTRRAIQGFKKLGRILDPTEANQVAVSGVSVIEQTDATIRVRHGLTTRIDTVITRTPSVTLTIQYVQQKTREQLDPFIGQKFSGAIIKQVERTLVGMFATLIDAAIVAKVAGISVQVDPTDPTIMRTESIYVPIFPLEYIMSVMQIRISS
jgi:hypothetical protein